MPIVTNQTLFTIAKLATELNTDPIGMGYNAATTQSEALANLLNQNPEPAGVIGGIQQIYKARTPTADMLGEIVEAAFTGLTVQKREFCLLIFGGEWVKTGSATLRGSLDTIFPTGATRTALIAAASRDASRAEALWGDGAHVTPDQVAEALGR